MQIQCPGCSKVLSFPDDQAGLVVACSACGGQMQLPAPAGEPAAGASGPSAPGASGRGATKACPHCGETILKAATKCRHCRSLLIGAGAGPHGPASRFKARRRGRSSGEGNTALVMGIASFFVCGPILAPLAIIYGSGARKNPAEAGPATVGMVLGIISLALHVLAFALLFLGGAMGGR